MMSFKSDCKMPLRQTARVLAGCTLVVGCLASAAPRHSPYDNDFKADTPFSKVVKGPGDSVCWNVKRAFLSQGYILDRGGDSVILTGTKDSQKDEKTNVTIRMQTTCVDNKDGTSTVFASAEREISELQKVRQGVSAGVSIATVTVPTGSENVLQVINRQTIQDAGFYNGFYGLVEGLVASDKGSHAVDTSEKDRERVAASEKAPERPVAREVTVPDRPAGADGGQPSVAGDEGAR